MLNPDYRDMLPILNDEGVEYLVVGAHALAASVELIELDNDINDFAFAEAAAIQLLELMKSQ